MPGFGTDLEIHVAIYGDEVAFVLHTPLESDLARLSHEALEERFRVHLPACNTLISFCACKLGHPS